MLQRACDRHAGSCSNMDLWSPSYIIMHHEAVPECLDLAKINYVYVCSCCALPSLILSEFEGMLDKFVHNIQAQR